LVDIGTIDVDAPLESLARFEDKGFKFGPWEGTRHLTYLLDQFMRRLKGVVSELTPQSPERKKSMGAKSGKIAG
jgi:hypothetical protein